MTDSGTIVVRSVTGIAVRAAILACCLAAPARADQPSAPTDSVGIAAGPQTLWVYQQRLEGRPQARTLRLAFAAGDAPFRRPGRVQAVTGEVGAAAVLGDRLFIVFADGTHRSYDRLTLRVERTLPGHAIPLSLAADHARNALYALVPTSVAVELLDTETVPFGIPDHPAKFTAPVEPPDPPPSTQPAPTSAPALPDSAYCLVRYARGRWHLDRAAPEFMTDPQPCLLAVSDGQCHLICGTDPADPVALYSRSTEDGWTAPLQMSAARFDQLLACGVFHGRFAVLAQSSDNAEPRLLWHEQDRFTPDEPLEGAAGAVAAAWFGSHLALAFMDAENELAVGTWPMQGGGATSPPAQVQALRPRHVSWIAENMALLAYGGLSLVMLVVFLRRRDSLLTPAALKPDQILAPFSRRLLGFLLDATLFLPVSLYLLWPAMQAYAAQHELDPAVDRMTLYRELPGDFFLRWLLAVALFALYGTIFEALFGATPGKRVVQCKVVNEQGAKPGFGAVALRNLLRLVEMFPPFDFMPAAVLVILTRNRQRLGDLIARTVVVEITRPPPDPQPEQEPHSADD